MAKEQRAPLEFNVTGSALAQYPVIDLGNWLVSEYVPGGGAVDLRVEGGSSAKLVIGSGPGASGDIFEAVINAEETHVSGDLFVMGDATVDGNAIAIGNLVALGQLRGQAASLTGNAPGTANNRVMYLPTNNPADSHYYLWADAAGAGSDNTRLWLDGPNGGEVVIGPRSSGSRLGQIRLRADNLYLDTPPYSGSAGYPVGYIRASGSWTPILMPSSGALPTVSYTSRSAFYVRINQVVYFSLRIAISSRTTHSGHLVIQNLPYAAANNSGARALVNVTVSNSTYPTGATQLVGILAQNDNIIDVYGVGSGIGYVAMPWNNMAATSTIFATGFYITSDS